jgi:hypothetical protein
MRIEQYRHSLRKTIHFVWLERAGHRNGLYQRLPDAIEVLDRFTAVKLYRPQRHSIGDFDHLTDRLIHEYANRRDVAGQRRGDFLRAPRVAVPRAFRPENESNGGCAKRHRQLRVFAAANAAHFHARIH